MLTRLRVQNFKCLRDVDVKLGPFTVLIGPNDSGKSSVLDAMHLLGRTTTTPIVELFRDDLDLSNLVWMRDADRTIEWLAEGQLNQRPFSYSLSLSPRKQSPVAEQLIENGQSVLCIQSSSSGTLTFDMVSEHDRTKHIDGYNHQSTGVCGINTRTIASQAKDIRELTLSFLASTRVQSLSCASFREKTHAGLRERP